MNPKTFNPKILALVLIVATVTGIALFPMTKQALAIQKTGTLIPAQSHRIEVVFVLDTTSSMSGLIQAAKDKIWSIASTMASAQQSPDIKMGLVAFRDRGDAYITRVYDLSENLDSMYVNLMDFRAQGGGDGPESVNQALYDAIHKLSWSQDKNVYKVVFLVGDAPPHMDYPNDVKYPVTLAAANRRGIVVNTIQSGQHEYTGPAWREIAALGKGEYFQVEDSGNAVAVATPFDDRLSQLARELEETRMYFGDETFRAQKEEEIVRDRALFNYMPAPVQARRSEFLATESGKKNLLGESELVDGVASGRIKLEDIPREELPASISAMAPEEQEALITRKAKRRDQLKQEIRQLSESRNDYIRDKVEAEGGADDSLDEKIYRAVRRQAAESGLHYDSDSARY